jgi:hypothetical protein
MLSKLPPRVTQLGVLLLPPSLSQVAVLPGTGGAAWGGLDPLKLAAVVEGAPCYVLLDFK